MGWCYLITFFMSKLSEFWVVTKISALIGMLFNSYMKRMGIQFKAGLSGKEIIGIFINKN